MATSAAAHTPYSAGLPGTSSVAKPAKSIVGSDGIGMQALSSAMSRKMPQRWMSLDDADGPVGDGLR